MKTPFLKTLIGFTIFFTALPHWAVAGTIPIRGFVIAQERNNKNGVLISRPVKTDARIAQIMNQNQIRTIQDYAAWLANNMIYQHEASQDTWLAPAEFLNTRRGDCEDFAILNQNVLRVLGYQSHVLTLISDKGAHAICAFEYGGQFYWFDNAELKTSRATTLSAFAQEITNQFHYNRSYKLDPLSKQATLLYQRS